MKDSTTISIKRTTWNALNLKKKCGQTFDDVISEMIKKENSEIKVIGEPIMLSNNFIRSEK